jgi:Inner centromere protein, ARK binding region
LTKRDLGSSRIGKPALNTSLSQSQLASSSTTKPFKQPGLPASASQPSVKLVGYSQGEPKSAGLPKVGGPPKDADDVRQPSQTLHAQMHARVQAQMLQARQEDPIVPSESIELPDVNSEYVVLCTVIVDRSSSAAIFIFDLLCGRYSNSDDEGRARTFDPPDWAQSPVLGRALQSQSRLNPDDIFGPVRPLRMEEIFKTRPSRFRARTSSANWAGADELTSDEQQEYAKRMGYIE